MSKYHLAAMTHAEFRARLEDPLTVVLPLGSQEVQGPHAPMGDYRLAEQLAVKSAELADAVVAPGLPFGYADFFRGFAGGMQLRPETFMAVLEDMIASFLDQNINRLLLFNGHTANSPLINMVVRRLRRERGVAVPALNIWQCIPAPLWTELYGDEADNVRGHGGEPISSVSALLSANDVRPDLMQAQSPRNQAFGLDIQGVSSVHFNGVPLQLPIDAHEVDANGLLKGSAHMATAERGEAICRHIVDHTARLITYLTKCDPEQMLTDPQGELHV